MEMHIQDELVFEELRISSGVYTEEIRKNLEELNSALVKYSKWLDGLEIRIDKKLVYFNAMLIGSVGLAATPSIFVKGLGLISLIVLSQKEEKLKKYKSQIIKYKMSFDLLKGIINQKISDYDEMLAQELPRLLNISSNYQQSMNNYLRISKRGE